MAKLKVNGRVHDVDVPDSTNLLYVLRNDIGLNGPKFGCGLDQCGACTVTVGGSAAHSCQITLADVGEKEVMTVEGLGTIDKPSKLQQAFIEEQAAQCGYCVPGMIMKAKALLDFDPKPTEAKVRSALNENLCRCGAHNRIVRAVLRASREA